MGMGAAVALLLFNCHLFYIIRNALKFTYTNFKVSRGEATSNVVEKGSV